MESKQTQIQISGDKGQLTVIIITLFAMVGLLMWLSLSVSALKDTLKETKTEVRILEMHVQDQNAILIRQGIKKPGDSTTGPTNPDKLEVKE